MVGVISMDFAMRSSKETTSDYTNMVMRLQAAMMELERLAFEVVGDASSVDSMTLGIHTNYDDSNSSFPHNPICFRTDTNTPITLDDYSDDVWACFYHGFSFDLYRYPYRNTPCDFDADCGGAAVHKFVCSLSEKAIFATVNTAGGDYLINGGTFDYLQITLTSRVYQTQPAHPIKNPEYTLTTRVSPPGISR